MCILRNSLNRVVLVSLVGWLAISSILALPTAMGDDADGKSPQPARVRPSGGAPILKPGEALQKPPNTEQTEAEKSSTPAIITKPNGELIPPPIVSSSAIKRKAKPKVVPPITKPPKKGNAKSAEPRKITHNGKVHNVRTATFKGVTPGITTEVQLTTALGEPKSKSKDDGPSEWAYEIGGFKRVVFVVDENVVRSAVIHLDEPVGTSKVVSELGLADLTSVEVTDAEGTLLGAAYPERGVVLSLRDSRPQPLVSQVVLDPITPELFLMRAEEPGRTDYTNVLADIKFAQKLDPNNAHAYWLQAEMLLKLGREGLAAAAADRAVELDEGNLRYRLTQAELIGRRGDDLKALATTRKIYEDEDATPFIRALASYQLGRWTAFGKRADYQKAVEFYSAAVEEATEVLSEAPVVERLTIAELIVQAQCAIAVDIAHGDFKRKETVVPKWLTTAREVIASVVEDGQQARMLQRIVDCRTLEAHAICQLELDPAEIAERAITESTDIFNSEGDKDYAQAVHWELGCVLYHAAELAKSRGERDAAKRFAAKASDLLEEGATQRDQTPDVKYLLGRSLFVGGAVEAVLFENHALAIAWYDRALPFMRERLPESQIREVGLQGERLVSMGVSYWAVDKQKTSVMVSKAGMRMMEDAVKRQWLDQAALAVPYGNLASMYSKLKDDTNASVYERLAEQVDTAEERR